LKTGDDSSGVGSTGGRGRVISVAVSTFNRPQKVLRLIAGLLDQTLADDLYEVILVDNGSEIPVPLPAEARSRRWQLIRLEENQERSRARSIAVAKASGEFILFLDDDLIVRRDLLEEHLRAQHEWPGVMAIGGIVLPPERLNDPGIRFRQRLELLNVPPGRGLVASPNFGTAANMSIRRTRYEGLGGFDPEMAGIEDQDFAMRHSSSGGPIAYLPDAEVIHDDDWLEFRDFCRRQERGMEWTVPFSRRYPAFADSIERDEVNGPLRLGTEPPLLSLKKTFKDLAGTPRGEHILLSLLSLLERRLPNSRLLSRAYRVVLGVYLRRGYLRGIARFVPKS
jgi:GT2 family glycosyltransferase